MDKCKTYGEQISNFIKEQLLKGELAPGDQVKEVALAGHLGISRGPVREAMQILVREGIIKASPQKARYIKELTSKEIADSYYIGGTLEGAGIVCSLHLIDETAMRHIGAVLERMKKQAHTAKALAELTAIDDEFHTALLAKCDNRIMMQMARKTCVNISKFLYYQRWNNMFTPLEFYERHAVIYAAVATRDPWHIETTLRAHYAESGKRLGRAL